MTRRETWDRRFLDLCELVASWSKDPSTRVGACVVDADRRLVSAGYNGLPRGVEDTHARLHDRAAKYRLIVHAERNALLFARQCLKGCTLYTWPFPPCAACAGMAVQMGIARAVSPPLPPELEARWGEECRLAEDVLREAGVEVCRVVR